MKPIQIIVGGGGAYDPIAGTTTIVYPLLAGVEAYLEKDGEGTMPYDQYTQLTTGGFELADAVFIDGEIYFIHLTGQVDTPVGNGEYSNGFNITPVIATLLKRIGWRPSTLAGSPTLNADNLTSLSKRYFQSFHAIVTPQNVYDVQENSEISDDEFNQLLTDLQTDAIMRCLTETFREVELLEQVLLYTRTGMMDIPVTNTGYFAGYMINIAEQQAYSTQINFATLYFDRDVTFNLYLFQDGIKTPLKTIEVSCIAWERTVVEFDSLVLNFKTGRKYYFGYFQADLGEARAIREQVETWARTLCFEAIAITAPPDEMFAFNHNYKQYVSLPYGLNLEMISFRDHTQKILRKPNLFDEAVGLQMAMMVIEMILNSTRTNGNERITKEISGKLYMDVKQAFPTKEVPVTAGLQSRFERELRKMRNTFFPPEEAMSTSMESNQYGLDSYEKTWAKANLSVMRNPPFQIQ